MYKIISWRLYIKFTKKNRWLKIASHLIISTLRLCKHSRFNKHHGHAIAPATAPAGPAVPAVAARAEPARDASATAVRDADVRDATAVHVTDDVWLDAVATADALGHAATAADIADSTTAVRPVPFAWEVRCYKGACRKVGTVSRCRCSPCR